MAKKTEATPAETPEIQAEQAAGTQDIPPADPAPQADKAPEENPPTLPVAPVVPPVAESAQQEPGPKLFTGRCKDCSKNWPSCVEYQEIDGKSVAIDMCLKDRGLI